VFTNILVPVDGSAESNAALPIARTLAQSTAGRITLLRVVRRDGLTNRSIAADELDVIARELSASDTSVATIVREGGDVAEQILMQIHDQAADLVIMRTHGRVGIGRAILGSVT